MLSEEGNFSKRKRHNIAIILKQSIEWTNTNYNMHFDPLDATIISRLVELIYKLYISANDALQLILPLQRNAKLDLQRRPIEEKC
jgi:hypothetical protein